MSQNSPTTLSQEQIKIIRTILTPFGDKIDRVGIFGSHATGRARPNSDIDLVIYGDIAQDDADRLWSDFQESSISVSVDIICYNLELYAPLRRHIDETAIILFGKSDVRQPHHLS